MTSCRIPDCIPTNNCSMKSLILYTPQQWQITFVYTFNFISFGGFKCLHSQIRPNHFLLFYSKHIRFEGEKKVPIESKSTERANLAHLLERFQYNIYKTLKTNANIINLCLKIYRSEKLVENTSQVTTFIDQCELDVLNIYICYEKA